MKIAITFSFTDEECRQIARYAKLQYGDEIPKGGFATREKCRSFINQALNSRWLELGDDLGDNDEL